MRGTDRAAWPLGEPSAECCLDTLCVCVACVGVVPACSLDSLSHGARHSWTITVFSQYVHVGGAGERVCRAHEGPVSNGTQCSVRLSPCSPHPPIAPCAHLHGAETLGGMQQHSRKESPGLPSSLVGCKCVPNLGRVRFFAVPCPARTRASPAPRNAFLLIHPCVRMVCNAFCAGAAMQGWVAGGSSGVGVCFMDSVFCPLLTPTARPPTSAAGHWICADWRDHGGWRGAATGERRRGVLGT